MDKELDLPGILGQGEVLIILIIIIFKSKVFDLYGGFSLQPDCFWLSLAKTN